VRRGEEHVRLDAAKLKALLALLLMRAREVCPSGRLVDELWEGSPPESGVKLLQVYVSQLRKQLHVDGEPVLVTRGGGYLLDVDPEHIDARRFERLVREGVSLRKAEPAAAVEAFSNALGLWRGPPLADFRYAAFAQPEVDRLEELRLIALEERFEAELALGEHAGLVGELEWLVSQEPLRERLHAQLMLALYRSGRQVEAQEVYRRLRETLVEELGIEPGPELRDLYGALLRHDQSLLTPIAPAPPARALPTGTLTFVFTDVASSTQLLREIGPERYAELLVGHRRILRDVFAAHGGVEVDTQGDSFFYVFERAGDAVAAAAAAQEALEGGPMLVRIGVHTGEPFATEDGYVGVDVHRAARIAAIAVGGQVLISQTTCDLVAGVDMRDLGRHRLKDLEEAEQIYQLGLDEFPPLAPLVPASLPVAADAITSWVRDLAEVLELLRKEVRPLAAARERRAPTAAEIDALVAEERTDLPFLHWRDEQGRPRIFLLPADHDRVTIGRSAGSDLSLSWDSEVSRTHAVLESIGGQWTLVDEGLSRNGSFVNGGRVYGRRSLRDRDRLCFGNTYVGFREPIDSEAESTARAVESPASIPLSPMQRKVLIALCRPLSDARSATPATNRQIADEVFLSVDAVKAHLRILFERFEIGALPQNEKRAQLAVQVLAAGVLAPHDF
jgi:DNA-binding SARP family transcriptional activator